MTSYALIVVLYNQSPSDSLTLKSLSGLSSNILKNNEVNVIIWVNTGIWTELDEAAVHGLLKSVNHQIIFDGSNTSLSRVYNVISKGKIDYDFLVLFDQDSVFGNDLFEKAISFSDRGILMLPTVFCGDTLVSPARRFISKGKRMQSILPGVYSSKKFLAINSGLFIPNSIAKKFVWNENLKFYGTDTDFMYNYEAMCENLIVLDSHIGHDLAEFHDRTFVNKLKYTYTVALVSFHVFKGPIFFLFNVFYLVWAISKVTVFGFARWMFNSRWGLR